MMSGFFFRRDWGLGAAVAVAFALEATLFSFESPVILRDGRIALLQPPGSVCPCLALRSLRSSLQYLLLPCLALLLSWRRMALHVWMVFIQVLADAEAVWVAGRVEHHEVRIRLRRVAKSPVKQDLVFIQVLYHADVQRQSILRGRARSPMLPWLPRTS